MPKSLDIDNITDLDHVPKIRDRLRELYPRLLLLPICNRRELRIIDNKYIVYIGELAKSIATGQTPVSLIDVDRDMIARSVSRAYYGTRPFDVFLPPSLLLRPPIAIRCNDKQDIIIDGMDRISALESLDYKCIRALSVNWVDAEPYMRHAFINEQERDRHHNTVRFFQKADNASSFIKIRSYECATPPKFNHKIPRQGAALVVHALQILVGLRAIEIAESSSATGNPDDRQASFDLLSQLKKRPSSSDNDDDVFDIDTFRREKASCSNVITEYSKLTFNDKNSITDKISSILDIDYIREFYLTLMRISNVFTQSRRRDNRLATNRSDPNRQNSAIRSIFDPRSLPIFSGVHLRDAMILAWFSGINIYNHITADNYEYEGLECLARAAISAHTGCEPIIDYYMASNFLTYLTVEKRKTINNGFAETPMDELIWISFIDILSSITNPDKPDSPPFSLLSNVVEHCIALVFPTG